MLPTKSAFNPVIAFRNISNSKPEVKTKLDFNQPSTTPFSGDFRVFDKDSCNTHEHSIALYDLAGTPHHIRAGFPLRKDQSEAYTARVVFSIHEVLKNPRSEGDEAALNNLLTSIQNEELSSELRLDLLRLQDAVGLVNMSRE